MIGAFLWPWCAVCDGNTGSQSIASWPSRRILLWWAALAMILWAARIGPLTVDLIEARGGHGGNRLEMPCVYPERFFTKIILVSLGGSESVNLSQCSVASPVSKT